MKINFDHFDDDLILYKDNVVMARKEEPYFKILFSSLEEIKPNKVLEVGYGLGISANLIQKKLKPNVHTILEIEDAIGDNAKEFCRIHYGAKTIIGDWINYQTSLKFDFISYDPFDYSELENTSRDRVAKKLKSLLIDDGIISHPHFGDGEVKELPGFNHHILARHKIPSFEAGDGITCEDVACVIRYKREDNFNTIMSKIKNNTDWNSNHKLL